MGCLYFFQELYPAIRCIFFLSWLCPWQKKKDAAAIGARWRPRFSGCLKTGIPADGYFHVLQSFYCIIFCGVNVINYFEKYQAE